MEYSLTMTFVDSAGAKVPMTISGVKETLAKADIVALMDTIIAQDIFTGKGGALVAKSGAQLTQRQTTKIEIQ
ncbi:DUF2922 domain-containing protein [Clostridium swellfunianum]|uniref:DUF2922 domain-containing protein n=1 Tax=Clostridium swellfunianum TaxID=1367462 RepID=UPI00202E3554|nr:DUF2922 domain-containing protein [Clostridium swellfunianum]MCM0647501.1 DUF2922 domain-containing protein [Clostridium swellfunianum]